LHRTGRYSVCSSCAIAIAALVSFFFYTSRVSSESRPVGIHVETNPDKPLRLRVTLQSFAKTRVTISRDSLPWGREDSMILVAVTPEGYQLDRLPFIDDPTVQEVSLEPGTRVNGEINLANKFKGLDTAVKKSDVHLFWAYKGPEELHIAAWSGGWILIPKQK
jgi:hypothetical protein